jgi:aryl-alcohol dehydrogenase-like predicted oxidoreductase
MAHIYAGGDSERAVGRWLETRGCRDRMVLITKGAHPNRDRKRVTPFDIASDLHDSLTRLRTDHVDLYLLHRDDPGLSVGLIMEALNDHIRAGRVRAIGASNWKHTRIAEANEYADRRGLKPFVASSPNFSLAAQVQSPWGPDCVTISGPANADARSWYERNRMPVFAWSSLARGFFSGRLKSSEPEGAKTVLEESSVRAYGCPENFERLARAERLAKQKGLTVPQLALAYVMAQPFNLFAIVGAASPDEMRLNVAALDARLTPEEAAWLDLRRETP